ncbi:MAG: glycosyltransferase family 2 protein, partial [Candidatus Levyibacteriota bacterium]
MKLSIIIPVFNEEKTIISVLESVINVIIPGFEKEIVIVNDGSQDNTDKAIKLYLKKNKKSILYLSQRKNLGKGAAVSIGLAEATGDYVVIQDADLEYSPKDLIKIAKEIKNNKKDIIFGTRLHRLPHFTKEENTPYFLVHYIGNRFLSLIT